MKNIDESPDSNPNKIAIGKNKKEYISMKGKNDKYKWIELKDMIVHKNYRKAKLPKNVYEIHDNGGVPFVVYNKPSKKEILLYKYKEKLDDHSHDLYKLHKIYKYKKLFVPNDPAYGYTGNTLLLLMNDGKYICIQNDISVFSAPEEITSYVSPMGNSDVPYPYAISKNFVYLVLENAYYEKNLAMGEDYYSVYYGHTKVKPEFDKKKAKKLKMKVLQKRIDFKS